MADWDVIVIGLGGVGSSTAYHCALTGARVLGLEQFAPVHDRGSSHGQTRIIRQAYFEHPSYVPLLQRAYTLWDQLENATDARLFERTGLVEAGPADGVVIPGVLASAHAHELAISEHTHREIVNRWSGLDGDPEWRFVIEENAGFLRVEACVEAHLRMAKHSGATLRFEQPVIGWAANRDCVEVTTDSGTERAERLILAGGAWSSKLIRELNVPLQILRKYLYWFEPDAAGFDQSAGFPCFFHETPSGYFYGFPSVDGRGVKVARHSGGQPIDEPKLGDCEDGHDRALCEAYVKHCLPGVSTRLMSQQSCLYTCTPDEHFIIDRHPHQPRVTVVAGLSGHGFKFTSVLGEVANQVSRGESHFDLGQFSLRRFQTK